MTDTESVSTPETSPEIPTMPVVPQQVGRRWLAPLLFAVGGFVLGGMVVGAVFGISLGVSAAKDAAHKQAVAASAAAAAAKAKSILPSAVTACTITDADSATIADDGYTLTVDGLGEAEGTGLAPEQWGCLLGTLNAPQSVLSHIDQTTSLDGRQTETWDKMTLSWTYHPDRGLDGVFTLSH